MHVCFLYFLQFIACSRVPFLQCSGSDPPVPGQAVLTFHSSDTDHIFKCIAISNASQADAAITKFIRDREFLSISPAINAPVPQGAAPPTEESDDVNTVATSMGRNASTSDYNIAKSNDVRLLNTFKCAENRVAIYVLNSHAERCQLPNGVEILQSSDDIHVKARKLADELSGIHRKWAGLKCMSRCAAAAAAPAPAPANPLPASSVFHYVALQRAQRNMQQCSFSPKFAPSLFHWARHVEPPCALLDLPVSLASAPFTFRIAAISAVSFSKALSSSSTQLKHPSTAFGSGFLLNLSYRNSTVTLWMRRIQSLTLSPGKLLSSD